MRKKSRIIFFSSAILLLLILQAGAAKTPSLQVESKTAKPGETVEVCISVENNPGIQGATLTVTWDAGLTLKEKAKNGAAFAALNLTAPKKLASPYNLFWYAQDLEAENIKDGVIATFTFEVSDQAKTGDTLNIGVSYVSGDIVDRNKQSVSPTVQNGMITVGSAGHTHSFDKKLATEAYLAKAATCTEAAVYYTSCQCGEKGTATFTSGAPLGHNFVGGECTRCHIADTVAKICTVRVSQVTAKPGDTVTAEIAVANNPGIQGATLTVTWDAGLTLMEKAQNGAAFEALNLTAPKKLASPYNLFWYAQDLETEDIKDGVIAALEFEVSAQAKDGDILSVSVSYVSGDIVDRNKQAVECAICNGGVTVSNAPVQAKAAQTEKSVTVEISCDKAAPQTSVFLARYSEQGKFTGCFLQTVDLAAGKNTITFGNSGTGMKQKVFVWNSGQLPLCASILVEKT